MKEKKKRMKLANAINECNILLTGVEKRLKISVLAVILIHNMVQIKLGDPLASMSEI